VKRGVVRCLHDRARGIISAHDNVQKEVDHLARVLKQNGYPANFIRDASAPAHTGNSRRKQPRGGKGEETAGDYTLYDWDECGHQACLQDVFIIRVVFKSGGLSARY